MRHHNRPNISLNQSLALAKAAKKAATALAEFWDELHLIEIEHSILFDGTVKYIEEMAKEVSAPPSEQDFSALSGQQIVDELPLERVQPKI